MKRHSTFERGLSMVELLVALTIGSLLIVGALFVYSQSRTTHTLSETVARVQENARFVLAVLEPDVQLAGNYGYSNQTSNLRYSDGTYVTDMKLGDGKFGSGPAAEHACGDNFALDLMKTVQGVENDYGLACDAFSKDGDPGAVVGSDTLIIRRASTTASLVPNGKKLQLVANRMNPINQVIFSGATSPLPTKTGLVDIRDLMANVYYVSKDSNDLAGYPSLRRKSLQVDPADNTLKMMDEEIMAGVEDLQVQFGIDMGADSDGDGIADDIDGNGVADLVNGQASRYVNPNDAASAKFGQIVSVRLWVRLRAEQGEVGFNNQTHYLYGTTDFTANDNIRRIVATRTFFLRNSRSLRNLL